MHYYSFIFYLISNYLQGSKMTPGAVFPVRGGPIFRTGLKDKAFYDIKCLTGLG